MQISTLKIIVGNISSVMSFYDQIKIYRSTTGATGAYTELTGPGTRIALQNGVYVYSYIDTAGSEDYYYKTSCYRSSDGSESALSDAVQGEDDTALNIISVQELKTFYLFGLDLTDDSGTEYPDSLYQWFIKSAVTYLEQKLDIPLRPLTIEEERHDFVRQDYYDYMWFKVREYPIISVEEVKMVLPSNQSTHVFEDDWIHPRKESGVIHIIPGTGNVGQTLFSASGVWLPLIRGYGWFLPDAFRISYTAGFEAGKVPDNIKDLVGKIASFGPLNIAGDLLGGAGIASQAISIDGLSQSFNTTSSATNSGYGARILAYQKEIKSAIPTIRSYYKGIGLTVG